VTIINHMSKTNKESSIINRDSEDALNYCEKEKMGFIPWVGWLLQRSPIMLPIPGTSSLAHLEENMAAAKLQLGAEEWKRIEDLARTS
jgi:pyridoxine 4-dehydrogenase